MPIACSDAFFQLAHRTGMVSEMDAKRFSRLRVPPGLSCAPWPKLRSLKILHSPCNSVVAFSGTPEERLPRSVARELRPAAALIRRTASWCSTVISRRFEKRPIPKGPLCCRVTLAERQGSDPDGDGGVVGAFTIQPASRPLRLRSIAGRRPPSRHRQSHPRSLERSAPDRQGKRYDWPQ